MKPMNGCALFGAYRALAWVRDAVIVQHSVVGCNWGTLAMAQSRLYDIRQASTVIYEDDVIYGGCGLVTQALREIDALYPDCSTAFVISGCVPNMIGDDVQAAVAEYTGRKQIVCVSAPGYAGSESKGMERALLQLASLCRPCERTTAPSINIFGVTAADPYALNDLQILRGLLASKIKINCAVQDCCAAELARLPAAHLNIVFGGGVQLAQKLQQDYGTPYVELAYPYGVQGMLDFLQILERELTVDLAAVRNNIIEESKALVRKTAVLLPALYGLPAALAGSGAQLEGMRRFVQRELGMEPVICVDADREEQNALARQLAYSDAVLLFGSSLEKALAEKYQLPLVRYAYPVFDEYILGRQGLLGVQGTALLLEKIINGALQQNYKSEGLFSGLRRELGR